MIISIGQLIPQKTNSQAKFVPVHILKKMITQGMSFSAMTACIVVVLLTMTISEIKGHGRLITPPSRASMWRQNYNNPPNYNDNQLFCGGRSVRRNVFICCKFFVESLSFSLSLSTLNLMFENL